MGNSLHNHKNVLDIIYDIQRYKDYNLQKICIHLSFDKANREIWLNVLKVRSHNTSTVTGVTGQTNSTMTVRQSSI